MIDILSIASSSAGNAYRITDGETPLLLEAGVHFKDIQRALNFKMSEIAGCLLTHEHGDHSKSIKEVMKAGIDVYTSQGTADALNINSHRLTPIRATERFNIGTWTILPFEVQHDAAEPLGFVLASKYGGKLLFITDSYYSKYTFNGLTHIMLEINYCSSVLNKRIAAGEIPLFQKKRLLRSHFSLENAVDLLKSNDLSKAQEIHVLHLSDGNSDEQLIKTTLQKVTGKPIIVAAQKSKFGGALRCSTESS